MSFEIKNGGNGGGPTWEVGEGWEIRPFNLKLITRIAIGIAAVILIILALNFSKDVFTDWLWFDSLGFSSVYKKILLTRIWLFFGGALVVAGFLALNLYIAYRIARGESILPAPPHVYTLARWGIIVGAVLFVLIASLVFGIVAQGRWETFLLYFNRVSFGVEDPQFSKDMSFHVTTMPMLHFIQGWLMGLVITIAVAVMALYFAIAGIRGIKFNLTPKIRVHLAALGAALMLTIAAAHYLDIFELVFSGRGAAPGAGYTDVNARIPVLWLLVAISLVSAVGFVTSIYYGGLRLMVASFSLWAVLAVLAGAIYPVIFQSIRVNPNELTREENFIERAIQSTRDAYNLSPIEEIRFPFNPTLDFQNVVNNPETINNIRLWDPRPLRDTYNQIQTFAQYYNYVDVDVDRYSFPDGDFRQVMLSARELFPENLEEDAQNWVNRKLVYTHGFGVAMSPVNEATVEGRPTFFLKDVPPQGRTEILQPEVYYGENTTDFVIVNSDTDEFNFPGSEGDAIFKNYEGTGGVGVGSLLRRIAYSWELFDFNLLISGQIASESKVLYRREIQDRVHTIAPFLRLDSDPYIVVGDGSRLWWIQDAYTVTDRHAYSAAFRDDFNYIRNSVKVVIDAYNGTVHFFVIEPEDPLIQIYIKAFPDLFEDFDEIDNLDPSLREHIRYPLDFFSAQAEINLRYHMTDPREFFQREDLWAVAKEVFNTPTNTQDIEPYYIIMKLPGEEKEEFVLLLPFTPGGVERKNMVGWMAARSDGEHYGKTLVFTFPKDRTVFGPEQIEGRITGDDKIGRELSLLCPEGKLCIRGNLIAIPMDDTLLYVEPLYIRAQALPLPELKKVIVADSDKVVMEDTLCGALSALLNVEHACPEDGGVLVPEPPDTTEPEPTEPPTTPTPAPEGIQEEITRIQDVIGDLRTGLQALEEALSQLTDSLGGTATGDSR